MCCRLLDPAAESDNETSSDCQLDIGSVSGAMFDRQADNGALSVPSDPHRASIGRPVNRGPQQRRDGVLKVRTISDHAG
jgi:hypothetical protein